MKDKRMIVIMWIFSLVPLLVALALLGRLPDEMPMHWGLGGTVGYEPRGQYFLMLGLNPLLALLFQVLPKIDPRRANYAKFAALYDAFAVFMMVFLMVVDFLMMLEALYPGRICMWRTICAMVGALFVFIGNIMPKVKTNFFMGVRTPWALSDKDVWNRSQRVGGIFFFTGGLIIVLGSLLLHEMAAFMLLMAVAFVCAIVPTVLSYVWYRNKHGKEEDAQ